MKKSKMSATVLSFVFIVLLAQAYSQTDQCSGPSVSLTINSDADVRFTVILSLRESTNDNRCGSEWSDVALQTIGVIEWAVERINNASFIQDVKIGFDVYDDCGIDRYSIGRAIDVVDGLPLGSEACAGKIDSVCQIGIIGTSRSDTTAAVLEIISGTNVPVLNPFATYPDLGRFSNFYRTTLSQDYQIQAILDYLVKVNWRYIAVVHTDDLFGQHGAEALKTMGMQKGICVDVMYKISNVKGDIFLGELFSELRDQKSRTKSNSLGVVFLGGKDAAKHLLTQLNFSPYDTVKDIYWVMPDLVGNDIKIFEKLDNMAGNKTVVFSRVSTDLNNVKTHVLSKWERAINNSKYGGDGVEALYACSGKTEIPEWTNQNAESVLDAVYVLASALQRQQRLYCPGHPGICEELKRNFNLESDVINNPLNYTDMADEVTVPEYATTRRVVKFTTEGELVLPSSTPLYELFMYTRYANNSYGFLKVAEIKNNTVTVADDSNERFLNEITASECGQSCPACINISDLRYIYVEGDSLILALFSFHETNPEDPFRCGEVRLSSSDILILEAFLQRLDQLNENTGTKFGTVVFDDCYSSAQTELIITQFLSGDLKLKKPNSTEYIDTTKILAAVGSLGSDVTIPLSFLFTKLRIPFISSTSSSADLDDRVNFPYFLRTVPSDVEQARAMVDIMKVMGWEYASVLYVSNNYGSKGKEQLLLHANKSNICVAEVPEAIPEVDADKIDLQDTFLKLKNQNAKVVLYFGTEARIVDFLQVIDNRNDFVFLASEDWADQKYILVEGGLGTLGSVVLKNQVASLTKDDPLMDYIKKLNPYNNARNPWFMEYWEHTFECDLPLGFENKFDASCDSSEVFKDDFIYGLLDNQRVTHMIDATEAVIAGLKKSRTELCEFDNSFPCPNYFKYIPTVVTNIKHVMLRRGSSDVRVFKEDGNGNVGFNIFSIQQDENQQLIYVPVGSFNDEGIHLSKPSIKLRSPSFNANCTPSLCSHCANMSKEGTSQVVTYPADNTFTAPHYTIIGLLAFLIVMVLIMMVVVFCYFKRRVAVLQKRLVQTCNDLRQNTIKYQYMNQNGTAVNNVHANDFIPMNFVKLGPSGETIQDWRDAQSLLDSRNTTNDGNASRNGVNHVSNGNATHSSTGNVNRAFVGDDTILQSSAGETNLSNMSSHSPQNAENTTFLDSPSYKPSKSSYGISTHNSFKRVEPSVQQTAPLKKQPRTQLAVPPCRPELPPRNEHAQRPNNLDLVFPAAVPKDKPRKHRSPPRKSSLSPRELNYAQSLDNPRNYQVELDSPRTKAHIPYMAFSAGTIQSEENQISPSGRINVHGSMEKISRV